MECKCEKLIDSFKGKRGRVNTLKMIKECSAIENPNILEQHNLCEWKRTLTHVPFSIEENEIYKFCKECELNLSGQEIYDAIHSGKYGEIIWGRVHKN